MSNTYTYKFPFKHYDVEFMMSSGLVVSFEYDGEFMIIFTSTCCDHWFA